MHFLSPIQQCRNTETGFSSKTDLCEDVASMMMTVKNVSVEQMAMCVTVCVCIAGYWWQQPV